MATGLKITGLNRTVRNMRQRGQKLKKNRRTALFNIITEIDQVTKRNFDTSGMAHKPSRGKWQALKPATIKQKQKIGASSQPLIRSGNLKRFWLPRVGFKRATYTSQAVSKKGIPYGAFHHTGVKKKNLPKRRFLPFPNHLRIITKKHIGRAVKVAINLGLQR